MIKITFPHPEALSPLIDWKTAKQLLQIVKHDGRTTVHSMQGGVCLMGCDVDLAEIEKDALAHGISLAGPRMSSIGHALAIVKPTEYKVGRKKEVRQVATFYEVQTKFQPLIKAAGDQWEQHQKNA